MRKHSAIALALVLALPSFVNAQLDGVTVNVRRTGPNEAWDGAWPAPSSGIIGEATSPALVATNWGFLTDDLVNSYDADVSREVFPSWGRIQAPDAWPWWENPGFSIREVIGYCPQDGEDHPGCYETIGLTADQFVEVFGDTVAFHVVDRPSASLNRTFRTLPEAETETGGLSGYLIDFVGLEKPILDVTVTQFDSVDPEVMPQVMWDDDSVLFNFWGTSTRPEEVEVLGLHSAYFQLHFAEDEDPIDPDPDPTCLPTDTDCDGDVDMADLLAVMGDWTGAAGAGPQPGWIPTNWTGAQVPEPAVAPIVFGLAAAAAAADRRRRVARSCTIAA